MGTICLTPALILRCESLSHIETIVLVIPPALGLIFATTLIVAKWGMGSRKHYLLAAEGFIYFALALLDLLSHILPSMHESLIAFKIIDIIIGAVSSVPLFFYVLYLYLQAHQDLIPTLPVQMRLASRFLLMVFIPALVAINAVGSFLGISYRTFPDGGGKTLLAIGFVNDGLQQAWTFLTSLLLALLTAFQAIVFSMTFYRMIKAFVDQRRIENASADQRHMYKGVGWTALGIKLSAIETVIGFAMGSFGVDIVRRILRLLGRAFIIIGAIKGVDLVEDFQMFSEESRTTEKKGFRASALRLLISNPRNSTFAQMSPTATAFHASRRNRDKSPFNPDLETTQERSEKSPQARRVTVHYDAHSAPKLNVRFSGLNFPDPAIMVENMKARRRSMDSIAEVSSLAGDGSQSIYRSTTISARPMRSAPTFPTKAVLAKSVSLGNPKRPAQRRASFVPEIIEPDTGRTSEYTQASGDMGSRFSGATGESAFDVGKIASQFPGLPPRTASGQRYNVPVYSNGKHTRGNTSESSLASTATSTSSRRPLGPRPNAISTYNLYDADHLGPRPIAVNEAGSPAETDPDSTFSRRPSVGTPATDRSYSDEHERTAIVKPGKQSLQASRSGEWVARSDRQSRHPAPNPDYAMSPFSQHSSHLPTSAAFSHLSGIDDNYGGSRFSGESSVDMNWLNDPERDLERGAVARGAIARMQAPQTFIPRIKTVGTVKASTTPIPTESDFGRTSVAVEHHERASAVLEPMRNPSNRGRQDLSRVDSGISEREEMGNGGHAF